MEHLFDTGFAKKYGVDAAILIRHLQFWLLKNKADKRHQHDGRTWTYGSVRSFAKLFPYWTSKHITRLLNTLMDKGILLKANHNKTTYDRTLWYAFADEETFLSSQNPISQKGKMDYPKGENGFPKKGKPIPDNNPSPNRSPGENNKGVEKSADNILELDCQIKRQANFLSEQLESIFHPQGRSQRTFANIIRYFVASVQADSEKLSWFKDAVEWAKVARIDGKKAGGKALFVQTVKERTGYGKNPKLLSGKSRENPHARASPAA